MGLKKGQTNNLNGRPKGIPNKTTTEMRKWLKEFLEVNREQIEKDFKALEPHQRLQIFERLLQYTLPKMQSVEANVDIAPARTLTKDEIKGYLKDLEEYY